jgi:hypothetical protein
VLPSVRQGQPGPFYDPDDYIVFGGVCVEMLITVMVVLTFLGVQGVVIGIMRSRGRGREAGCQEVPAATFLSAVTECSISQWPKK